MTGLKNCSTVKSSKWHHKDASKLTLQGSVPNCVSETDLLRDAAKLIEIFMSHVKFTIF